MNHRILSMETRRRNALTLSGSILLSNLLSPEKLSTTYVCLSMLVYVLCTFCIFFLPTSMTQNCQITLCLNEEWPIMSLCACLHSKINHCLWDYYHQPYTLHSLKKKVKWSAVIYHTYICKRAIRLDRKRREKDTCAKLFYPSHSQ